MSLERSQLDNAVPDGIIPVAKSCAIVLAEADSGGKLRADFEAMAKRRYQDPKPKREGNFWYLLTWEDGSQGTRKRKREKLAPASMPVREVQKIADEILRPLNQALISVGSAVNFREYVEGTYMPTELPLLQRPRGTRTKASSRNALSRDSALCACVI